VLYEFPKSSAFGRMLAKGKIYERATMTPALKSKFVNQIEKIAWQYKLSPETINLPSTTAVPEIQVFNILLKGDEIEEILLRTIDKAIPYPIYFQLIKQGKVKVKAAYKHPSEAKGNSWLIEPYLETEWLDLDAPTVPLPIALDLEKLYDLMLKSLVPNEISEQAPQSSIKEQVDKLSQWQAKEKAYEKLKAKRDKEKQFNRKVELNTQLKQLKNELEKIKSG